MPPMLPGSRTFSVRFEINQQRDQRGGDCHVHTTTMVHRTLNMNTRVTLPGSALEAQAALASHR